MPRAPLTREVQVSKKIAWLLRHGAEKEGLQMTAAGYANVQDVLKNRNIRSFKVSFDELQDMVASNDKKRFTIVPVSALQEGTADAAKGSDVIGGAITSSKPGDYMIRANQGHSVAVESESLLSRIDHTNVPTICVHGTTHGAWPLIVASGGLKPMTRQHVHFAAGLPAGFKTIPESDTVDDGKTADGPVAAPAPVISGMRNSSTVLIYLDIGKAIDDGLRFWTSENGVILTEGNSEGLVPLTYFRRVEDRTGGHGILVEDGKILKEPPPAWEKKGTVSRGGRANGNGQSAQGSQP